MQRKEAFFCNNQYYEFSITVVRKSVIDRPAARTI
jgi:hypothetical protein